MADNQDGWLELQDLIDDQLKLQIEIAFQRHYEFMVRHGLKDCRSVLDLGTGNGAFLRRLAGHEPKLYFIGVDKREALLDLAREGAPKNTTWHLLDAEATVAKLDYGKIDAVLMRYFLLHIPNARQLLQAWIEKLKPGTRIWIIDVDLSKFECEPLHPAFEKLARLVQDFCSVHSVDTNAGQKLGTLLTDLGCKNVEFESDPFASGNTEPQALAKFLRQEAMLYACLLEKPSDWPDLAEISAFIDDEVVPGRCKVSYGMVCWSATVG